MEIVLKVGLVSVEILVMRAITREWSRYHLSSTVNIC